MTKRLRQTETEIKIETETEIESKIEIKTETEAETKTETETETNTEIETATYPDLAVSKPRVPNLWPGARASGRLASEPQIDHRLHQPHLN